LVSATPQYLLHTHVHTHARTAMSLSLSLSPPSLSLSLSLAHTHTHAHSHTLTLRTMKIRANFLFWSRNFQLVYAEVTSLSSALLLLLRLFVSLSSQSPEGVPCYSDFRYLPTMNDGWSDFLLAESACRYYKLSTSNCTLCFWVTLNAPDA
jgi:hypothetical protein